MRLYSIELSPFAARVRAAIYFKGLPVECVAPPAHGTRSTEYLAINSIGKLPALELDDGTIVPESETTAQAVLRRTGGPTGTSALSHSTRAPSPANGLGRDRRRCAAAAGAREMRSLTSADCRLFPTLYLVELIAPRFEGSAVLAKHARAPAYFRAAQADPILRRVLDEMTAGIQAAGHA